VANPNIPLLNILPSESALQARLLAPAAAVGFIQPGKEVNLRYAAYPYQRFGHQRGTVSQISKAIVTPNELPSPVQTPEPFYLVTVVLDRQDILAYGERLPLQPGMTLEADVLLDKRPVYQWVLEPLLSIKGRV
jgi:membrane fusion protein